MTTRIENKIFIPNSGDVELERVFIEELEKKFPGKILSPVHYTGGCILVTTSYTVDDWNTNESNKLIPLKATYIHRNGRVIIKKMREHTWAFWSRGVMYCLFGILGFIAIYQYQEEIAAINSIVQYWVS